MNAQLERSKKYINYSDDQLIKLFAQDVSGQDAHYLDIELIHRGLTEKADQAKRKLAKKSRPPKSLLLLPLYAAGAIIIGYFKQYF